MTDIRNTVVVTADILAQMPTVVLSNMPGLQVGDVLEVRRAGRGGATSTALKAMAEAMAKELFRQSREPATANVALKPRSPGNRTDKTMLSGWFDLEKVARAGLLAIRDPDDAMKEACNRAAFAQGGGAIIIQPVYQAMIDAAAGGPA